MQTSILEIIFLEIKPCALYLFRNKFGQVWYYDNAIAFVFNKQWKTNQTIFCVQHADDCRFPFKNIKIKEILEECPVQDWK